MPPRQRPTRGRLEATAHLSLLTLFSFALYWPMFSMPGFSPEFPLYYVYSGGLTFGQMLRTYTYNQLMWYRPTSSSLFYWAGDQFLQWHNLAGWRVFHLVTVLATASAIYWLVVRCLEGRRLAGLFAGLYFVAQPCLYATVVEVAAFDFIHILVTILCVGFYLRGRKSPPRTAAAWVLFVIALTAKEVALAIPFYLAITSVITRAPRWRECLRLAPFFALLPIYYFFHLARIPASDVTASGPYRFLPNWGAMAFNLKRFALWIARIYAGTEEPAGRAMYQSTALNNAAGIALLALVAAGWWALARRDPRRRTTLALLVAWVGAFLVMPVYAGGYLWHINLPMVGYAAACGFGLAWWLERIAWHPARYAVAAFALIALFAVSRSAYSIEMDRGTHATAYHLSHDLLAHPPVEPSKLGATPLIYMEDRVAIGPWWYGCFGSLFKYVYLRHDIEEVIVPGLARITPAERTRWLAHPNAYFFRYDDAWRWRDASQEFRDWVRSRGEIRPSPACAGPGGRIHFALAVNGEPVGGTAQWSVTPAAGSFDAAGVYTAPLRVEGQQTLRVTVRLPGDEADRATGPLTLGTALPIRVIAGGPALADGAGAAWSADRGFDTGLTHSTAHAIAGASTSEVYQYERYSQGPFAYHFCVPAGDYRVRLKFAEIFFRGAGQRVFDVVLNGGRVLAGFDPAAAAGGPFRAADREFRVRAADSGIRIEFRPVVSNPKISAIEIDAAR